MTEILYQQTGQQQTQAGPDGAPEADAGPSQQQAGAENEEDVIDAEVVEEDKGKK